MDFDSPDTREAAEFQRALNLASQRNGGGDVCHGCKRRLQHGEMLFVGYDRKRQLLSLGTRCRWRLNWLAGFGVYYSVGWLTDSEPAGHA